MRRNADPESLRATVTLRAVAYVGEAHGSPASTMALVCDSDPNGERKDRQLAFGKRRLRMLFAREPEYTPLVRSHQDHRGAVVPRLLVLPDESPQSPNRFDDSGGHSNRRSWQDTCSRGRGRN